MKKLILLFAVFLSLSACNNQTTEPKPDAVRVIKDTLAETIMRPFNEKPNAKKIYAKVGVSEDVFLRKQDATLNGLLAGMKTKPQHFTINTTEPSEVQGEQGTKLVFNPNSFTDKNGKEITAPVDIELKECYKLDEMLRENLTGNPGDKLMESRGMICINASSGGEELKLKDGEMIRVRFPFTVQKKDRYKFFYGDEEADGNMNWTPAPETTVPQYFGAKEFTLPEFSYNGLELKNYLHETLTYPEEAKRNELSAKVEVSFLIDKNGKVTEVNTRESYKIFRNEIARVLNNMPGWIPATYGGKNIPAMVHVDIDFNIRRFDQVQVDFTETEASLVNTAGNCYMEYGSDSKNPNRKNGNSQSFDKLGWYNCSREVATTGAMADVVIAADSKSDVKLILKNRTAVTGGQNCVGYSRFKNLPVNAEVFVMAVRYDGKQIEYALQPLKLEKQNVVSLVWRKGDEAAVEKVYKRIAGHS